MVLGSIGAAAVLIALAGSPAVAGSFSQGNPTTVQAKKNYRATRPLVVDQQTGQRRMPNQQEIDRAVESLQTLTNRPTEGLPQAAGAGGAEIVDLGEGFAGVMLARPNADGTWETQCVFTFDEGLEFLGLVLDDAAR
jgi:hypothetical protein